MKEKHSFEEFKLVYESTEKVTDRRLNNNKLNYTICIATIAALGVIWKWSIENGNYFFSGLLLVIILAILAIFFCSLWIGQIQDFKKLNSAKFEVMNEMAENLFFTHSENDINVVSFKPFEKEWQKLSTMNALQKENKSHLTALKSSNTEFFIPKAFRLIFTTILIVSIITIAINPSQALEGIKFLIHIK